jgi:hypothetical protein
MFSCLGPEHCTRMREVYVDGLAEWRAELTDV